MFGTVEVEVLRPKDTAEDEFGNLIPERYEREVVDCVLVEPGGTSDFAADRPDGYRVDMTFHFPYWYEKSLRGCLICYEDEHFSVIGSPQPYQHENTPGNWNRPVKTQACDG